MVYDYILNQTPEKAREIGIKHSSTLKKINDRVEEVEFKLDTKEMRKIIEYLA